jgi:hypothetical protein
MEGSCGKKARIREDFDHGLGSTEDGHGSVYYAWNVDSRTGKKTQGSVCDVFIVVFVVGLILSTVDRGLTAYNHNLDTSREYYPQVSCDHLDFEIDSEIDGSCAGYYDAFV